MSDITIKNNDLLNAAFNDEAILLADLPQLKRYLLACTEMRETDILNPRVKEGLPKRTEFIKQLIQLKQAEVTRRELNNQNQLVCSHFSRHTGPSDRQNTFRHLDTMSLFNGLTMRCSEPPAAVLKS
jgi:hypothetical protein